MYYYVYILKSKKDKKYYIGSTTNIEKQIKSYKGEEAFKKLIKGGVVPLMAGRVVWDDDRSSC